MSTELRRSGIAPLGDIPWGMHVSLFYETSADLLDTIVPYFAAGLEMGDLCAWVPSQPSIEQAAMDALRERVTDFDDRLAAGAIQFLRPEEFYLTNGRIDVPAVMEKWNAWDTALREKGDGGLRTSGNLAWLERAEWSEFAEYERTLQEFMIGRKILTLCTYPAFGAAATDVLDVAKTHHLVIARRNGDWELLEGPAVAQAKGELQRLNTQLEQRVDERTRQLARSNEELVRTDTYLELAQTLSHTGSCAWDPVTRDYTYWSNESYRIFGIEDTGQRPSRADILALIHPADRERYDEFIRRMATDGGSGSMELRIVTGRGVRYIHTMSQALSDESGRITEVVAAAMDITDMKRAAARLARAKRLSRERTLETRFSATLEERTRLAREIHDSLLQGATGVALQLRALLPRLGDAPASTIASMNAIVELAEANIRDARRAVWDMRSPALVQSGLPKALHDEVTRAAGTLPLHFIVEGTPRALSPEVEDTLFRIGQEAVVNATRHASASHIAVTLAYRPYSVRLTIADDGRGFRVHPAVRAHGGHWGLLGMHERAERIGASLTLHSVKGKGTTVEVRMRTTRAAKPRHARPKPRLSRAS